MGSREDAIAKANEFVNSWTPQAEGEMISGEVLEVGNGKNNLGEFQFILVRRDPEEGGRVWKVICGSYLETALENGEIEIGKGVCITFHGVGTPKGTRSGVRKFAVVKYDLPTT